VPQKIKDKKKIIFLVGPTAIGKTEVALILAKRMNAEIISCDSMQVYKGMDIGTQKPSLNSRELIRHHMIDIVTPDKEFSVADFRKRALKAIREIHKINKIPLFVGGTGLYMKVLIGGLFPSPPKDEGLRKRLYEEQKRHGGNYLHERLKKVDSQTAKIIHPNDTKKIVRALEVYYTTKKTMSELKASTKPLTDRFDVRIFALARERNELYRRINERVEKMFKEGFLEEAEKLFKRQLSLTARQAIGYREIFDYLNGKVTKEEAKELIKKNTRQYAKRQLTWFRNDKRVKWIEVCEHERPSEVAAKVNRKDRFHPD